MLHSINQPIRGHFPSLNQPIRIWLVSFVSNHFLSFSVQLLLKQMRNLINVKKMEMNVKSGRNKSLSKTSLHWRKKNKVTLLSMSINLLEFPFKGENYANITINQVVFMFAWYHFICFTRELLFRLPPKSRSFCIYIFHDQVISIQIWAFLFLYVPFFCLIFSSSQRNKNK